MLTPQQKLARLLAAGERERIRRRRRALRTVAALALVAACLVVIAWSIEGWPRNGGGLMAVFAGR